MKSQRYWYKAEAEKLLAKCFPDLHKQMSGFVVSLEDVENLMVVAVYDLKQRLEKAKLVFREQQKIVEKYHEETALFPKEKPGPLSAKERKEILLREYQEKANLQKRGEHDTK